MKFNMPLPKHLAEMPVLYQELEWLIPTFFELHTCRQTDGHIPWTAVYQWAQAHEIAPENIPYFSRLIFDMDLAYLDYRAEELEKSRKKGGKGGGMRQKQGIKTKGT